MGNLKHFVSIGDYSREELFEEIVPGAESMIDLYRSNKLVLPEEYKKVILLFGEASTRTQGSYETAATRLGWKVRIDSGPATSLIKNESIADTARMYAAQNANVIVMRLPIEGAQRFAGEILDEMAVIKGDPMYHVAVQNAGDGTNQHPSQAILDLVTIKRRLGRLDNFKIGILGDAKYGRTAHSLLTALALRDEVSVVSVSSPDTRLPEKYKKLFPGLTEGTSLELFRDCDIVYCLRLQTERFNIDPVAVKRLQNHYRITFDTLSKLKKDVIIMHPMPYVKEIHRDIRLSPNVVIDEQASYGIPTRMWLLEKGYELKAVMLKHLEQKCGMDIIIDEDLDRYHEIRLDRKKSHTHFQPIRNGIVIDHIPRGMGEVFWRYIKSFRLDGVKALYNDVPSRNGKKDVIKLDGCFIPDKALASIAFFADVTVNYMQDSRFRKIKMGGINYIHGLGTCPNSNCITNYDREARSKFTVIDRENAKCVYCERYFHKSELL